MKMANCYAKTNCSRVLLLCVAMILIGACASTSYDRHNLSRLWVDQQSGQIYFDATANASYPRESSSADAVRNEWIAEWLKLRNMCAEGFTVDQRRAIGSNEDNPHRHNLRYGISCQ